ncbi:MAG: hypothetical protein ACRDK4_11860 [Solirubrobacteraceae bacterium]
MAKILISEPHPDVRRLLARMVLQLGHEPFLLDAPTPEAFLGADVFLVEPAAPIGAVLAKAAELIAPALPIVFVTVGAPSELDIDPVCQVVKPFRATQLGDAIDRALNRRRRGGCSQAPQACP